MLTHLMRNLICAHHFDKRHCINVIYFRIMIVAGVSSIVPFCHTLSYFIWLNTWERNGVIGAIELYKALPKRSFILGRLRQKFTNPGLELA